MKKALFGLLILVIITLFVVLQKSGYLTTGVQGTGVATVGPESITSADLISQMYIRYHSPEIAQKQNLKTRISILNSMIENKLKMALAEEIGITKRPDMEEKRQKYLLDAANAELYKLMILNKVVSEEAIRDYYEHDQHEMKARHILLKWPENATASDSASLLHKAEDISRRARGGEDFNTLVAEFSEEPGAAERNGDLGWFGWGKMVPPFQEKVWTMNKGEISEPVKTRFGYHVIILDDMRQKSRPPLDESREQIRQTLSRIKRSEIGSAVTAHFDWLREQHQLTFSDHLDSLLTLINSQDTPGQTPFTNLPEYCKEWVVATTAEKQITVADLETEYGSLPNAPRSFPKVQTLKDLVDNQLIPEFLAAESREMGLLDNPDVKERAQNLWSNDVIKQLEAEEVTQKTKIEVADLQAWYDQHAAEYQTRPRVEVQEIFVSDLDLAQRLVSRLNKGADFGKLATRYTERESAKEKNGILAPFTRGRYGEMGKRAFAMQAGEISEPIPLGNKYSIIKVLNHYPAENKPFDDAKRQVRIDLEKQRHQELQDELLLRARQIYPVSIDTLKVQKLFM